LIFIGHSGRFELKVDGEHVGADTEDPKMDGPQKWIKNEIKSNLNWGGRCRLKWTVSDVLKLAVFGLGIMRIFKLWYGKFFKIKIGGPKIEDRYLKNSIFDIYFEPTIINLLGQVSTLWLIFPYIRISTYQHSPYWLLVYISFTDRHL